MVEYMKLPNGTPGVNEIEAGDTLKFVLLGGAVGVMVTSLTGGVTAQNVIGLLFATVALAKAMEISPPGVTVIGACSIVTITHWTAGGVYTEVSEFEKMRAYVLTGTDPGQPRSV